MVRLVYQHLRVWWKFLAVKPIPVQVARHPRSARFNHPTSNLAQRHIRARRWITGVGPKPKNIHLYVAIIRRNFLGVVDVVAAMQWFTVDGAAFVSAVHMADKFCCLLTLSVFFKSRHSLNYGMNCTMSDDKSSWRNFFSCLPLNDVTPTLVRISFPFALCRYPVVRRGLTAARLADVIWRHQKTHTATTRFPGALRRALQPARWKLSIYHPVERQRTRWK